MTRRQLCWCDRPGHPSGPCPVCGRPLDHHPDGRVTPTEWRGLARTAHARRAAGLPLTPLDRQAIDRYPTCPSLLEAS